MSEFHLTFCQISLILSKHIQHVRNLTQYLNYFKADATLPILQRKKATAGEMVQWVGSNLAWFDPWHPTHLQTTVRNDPGVEPRVNPVHQCAWQKGWLNFTFLPREGVIEFQVKSA